MIDAFLLISQVYERGDKIWLFGFSRGAWAARSLGEFIAYTGLLAASEADDDDAADEAERIWLIYKDDRGKKRWRPLLEAPRRNTDPHDRGLGHRRRTRRAALQRPAPDRPR
jgi:uncharacterized protein (DUF2235 family)